MSLGAIVDRFGGDLNSTPLHWATRWVDPNSLPDSGNFCHLLITTANVLDPDHARQNVLIPRKHHKYF